MSVEFVSSVRDNLAAPEVERRPLGFPNRDEAAALSPTMPAVLAQDLLEPILLDHARSYDSAEARFNTEVCDLVQDTSGVRATIIDRATGERTVVHAQYVIAADGAHSPIRRRLGIATQGIARIGEYLSVLFRADLDAVVVQSAADSTCCRAWVVRRRASRCRRTTRTGGCSRRRGGVRSAHSHR